MKKEDCDISVFTVALGGLLIGIVVLYFVGKLLGYTDASCFLKDHGSLIAGILGFCGIFILVWNQNKSTQKTVDATLRAIRLESFEIKRRTVINELISLVTMIREVESRRLWGRIEASSFKMIYLHLEKIKLYGGNIVGKDKLDCLHSLIGMLEAMYDLRLGGTYSCDFLPTLESRYNTRRLGLVGLLKKIKNDMSDVDRNTIDLLIRALDFEIKIHEGEPKIYEDPETGEEHETCEVQESYIGRVWSEMMAGSIAILSSLIESYDIPDVDEDIV